MRKLKKINREIRAVVPGHIQRGGSPCAYDKVLTSRLGAKGAELILNKEYGRMVAVVNNEISSVLLSVAVEKPKRVNPNDEIVKQVRMMGICLGD
jgi:6-phosphofructokinase